MVVSVSEQVCAMVFIAYAVAGDGGATLNLFKTKQQAAEFGRATVSQVGGRVRLYKVDNRQVEVARTAIPRGDLFAIEVITATNATNAPNVGAVAALPRYTPVRPTSTRST